MATDGKGRRGRQTFFLLATCQGKRVPRLKAMTVFWLRRGRGRVNGHRQESQAIKADVFFAGDLSGGKVASPEGDDDILVAEGMGREEKDDWPQTGKADVGIFPVGDGAHWKGFLLDASLLVLVIEHIFSGKFSEKFIFCLPFPSAFLVCGQ